MGPAVSGRDGYRVWSGRRWRVGARLTALLDARLGALLGVRDARGLLLVADAAETPPG